MDQVVSAVVIAPVTVGVVEAVKQTGYLSSRFAALVSIITATIITVVYFSSQGQPIDGAAILTGIVYGLAASGLYSGTQALKG